VWQPVAGKVEDRPEEKCDESGAASGTGRRARRDMERSNQEFPVGRNTFMKVTGRRRRTSGGGGALLRSTAAVGAAADFGHAGRTCSTS
jgi:hypothetical protein